MSESHSYNWNQVYIGIDCKEKDENIDVLKKTLHVEIPNWVHTFPNFINFCDVIKANLKIVETIFEITCPDKCAKHNNSQR